MQWQRKCTTKMDSILHVRGGKECPLLVIILGMRSVLAGLLRGFSPRYFYEPILAYRHLVLIYLAEEGRMSR